MVSLIKHDIDEHHRYISHHTSIVGVASRPHIWTTTYKQHTNTPTPSSQTSTKLQRCSTKASATTTMSPSSAKTSSRLELFLDCNIQTRAAICTQTSSTRLRLQTTRSSNYKSINTVEQDSIDVGALSGLQHTNTSPPSTQTSTQPSLIQQLAPSVQITSTPSTKAPITAEHCLDDNMQTHCRHRFRRQQDCIVVQQEATQPPNKTSTQLPASI